MTDKAKLYDVIRKPVITEKATMSSEHGAVVFEVAMASNKPQIRTNLAPGLPSGGMKRNVIDKAFTQNNRAPGASSLAGRGTVESGIRHPIGADSRGPRANDFRHRSKGFQIDLGKNCRVALYFRRVRHLAHSTISGTMEIWGDGCRPWRGRNHIRAASTCGSRLASGTCRSKAGIPQECRGFSREADT